MAVQFLLHLDRMAEGGWPSIYAAAYGLRGALIPRFRELAGVTSLHGHRYAISVRPPDTPRSARRLTATLSVLADEQLTALCDALDCLRHTATPMNIGDVPARLAQWSTCARLRSGELLEAPTAPVTNVTASFRTITTFAAGNRRTRAVADPGLVIGSWAASWNGKGDGTGSPASETGVPCPLDVAKDLAWHLEPTRGDLQWGAARFSEGSVNSAHAQRTTYGFTGSITLRLHRTASLDCHTWLARLARLAPFAGTGYHAQIGLGDTRIDAPAPKIRRPAPTLPSHGVGG